MHEHAKLSMAIHEEAGVWTSAMERISDNAVRQYLNGFSDYENEPRIRVWKRIVVLEAHKRGLI